MSVSTGLVMNAQTSTTNCGVVVLVGVMGSGKSTVGMGVARQLRCPFIDIDARIAQSTGKSVSEIFAQLGESQFRAIESDVLMQVMDESCLHNAPGVSPSVVIATGGGAVISQSNRDKIAAVASHVIWLDAQVDVLLQRTSSSKNTRPLLANDPQQTLSTLSAERAVLYQQVATAKVDTSGLTINQVIDAVEKIVCQGVIS